MKPKLSCAALSFRPAGRSFSFVPFRLVWFWRYELLWPHSDNHLHAVVEHALDGLTMSCRVREAPGLASHCSSS